MLQAPPVVLTKRRDGSKAAWIGDVVGRKPEGRVGHEADAFGVEG